MPRLPRKLQHPDVKGASTENVLKHGLKSSQKLINDPFTPEDNVFINESNGKYQIRISSNKDYAQRPQEIQEVLNLIDELLGANAKLESIVKKGIVVIGDTPKAGGGWVLEEDD